MEFNLGSPIVSSPVDVGEEICFGDISGELRCLAKKEIDSLAMKKSESLSTMQLDENLGIFRNLKLDGWIWAKPIVNDEIIYVTTLTGNIYAIDGNSLSIIWNTKSKYKGKAVGGSIIFDHSGQESLAIPFDKETVGIFDLVTGSVLGEFPVDEGVLVSPLVVDNLLYVIDREARVKTFSTGDRTLVRCFNLEKLEGCR